MSERLANLTIVISMIGILPLVISVCFKIFDIKHGITSITTEATIMLTIWTPCIIWGLAMILGRAG